MDCDPAELLEHETFRAKYGRPRDVLSKDENVLFSAIRGKRYLRGFACGLAGTLLLRQWLNRSFCSVPRGNAADDEDCALFRKARADNTSVVGLAVGEKDSTIEDDTLSFWSTFQHL